MKTSPQRLSSQYAIWNILHSLIKLITPVLSFTAYEAWVSVSDKNKQNKEKLFTQPFHKIEEIEKHDELINNWEWFKSFRGDVLKLIEDERVKVTSLLSTRNAGSLTSSDLHHLTARLWNGLVVGGGRVLLAPAEEATNDADALARLLDGGLLERVATDGEAHLLRELADRDRQLGDLVLGDVELLERGELADDRRQGRDHVLVHVEHLEAGEQAEARGQLDELVRVEQQVAQREHRADQRRHLRTSGRAGW